MHGEATTHQESLYYLLRNLLLDEIRCGILGDGSGGGRFRYCVGS